MQSYYYLARIVVGPAGSFGRSDARFPRPCRPLARSARYAVLRHVARDAPMSDGMNDPVRYFGRQVRKERLAAGWTLAEFGQRIGYDPAHVSRIESGKRPATAEFARSCDQAFPHRAGWFSEFYEESRTWLATPPWFRDWVDREQRAGTL